jgi:hypothetical protein
MKKILLTIAFCGLTIIAKSQNTSVEKSTYGIQTGFLGVWIHNESKLSNEFSLRIELGLNATIWGGSFYEKTGFALSPEIILEPRYYYNLNKRIKKSKRIDGNSGNFFSLKTSYRPNWFIISNVDNIRMVDNISIIPTWGIRRNIGQHFTYETGFGIGYRYYLPKKNDFFANKGEADVNLHLRIGYRF